MPLYEYECDACGRRFEVIQRYSDPPAETCTACGAGPVRKLFSSPAIQFKGSGWYITDYAKKDQKGEAKGEKGEKPEGAGSADTASAKDQTSAKDQATPKAQASTDKTAKADKSGGGEKPSSAPATARSSKTKAKRPSE